MATEGVDCIVMGEELESLYTLLESGKIPELQWKNPGRIEEERISPDKKVENTENLEMQKTKPTKNDFDFSDDFFQPRNQSANRVTTPKSAKKKTATFADVMKRIGK